VISGRVSPLQLMRIRRIASAHWRLFWLFGSTYMVVIGLLLAGPGCWSTLPAWRSSRG